MVSEHASPLAAPGSPDAGGQNVHVAELSRALAAAGHEVTVLTRRDDPDLPELVPLHPGVVVHHIDAGPARPVPKDELVPHLPALADGLERAWRAEPPDVVHAHFWMSGLAATAALRDQDIPFVQTFHALGSVKRRHQRAADTSPSGRIARGAGARPPRRPRPRDVRRRAVRADPHGRRPPPRVRRALWRRRGRLLPGRTGRRARRAAAGW
jgi:glycosyltransferase involved in cell wall biosynthesis